MEFLAAFALLAASGAYVWNLHRRHDLRAGREMTKRIRALERHRRDAIHRAIAEGRAVDDPADAAFALEWIAFQEQAAWGRRRAFDFVFDVLTLSALVLVYWTFGRPLLLLVVIIGLAALTILMAALHPITRRAERAAQVRREHARAANERLLSQSP